jgi:hypothetical protein
MQVTNKQSETEQLKVQIDMAYQAGHQAIMEHLQYLSELREKLTALVGEREAAQYMAEAVKRCGPYRQS